MKRALQVWAGPRARAHLRERGLKPADVRVIPAAAGGPKGLVLNPLDRYLFGKWLAGSTQTLHLPGASSGAWRLACACRTDADRALAEFADDYIAQTYPHEPGKAPAAAEVSRIFGAQLQARVGDHAAEILAHPQRRLHVFTSRGRGLLARSGRWRTPLGYAGAVAANLVGRRAMSRWLERVVIGDPRDALPFPLDDFRHRRAALTPANLQRTVLASCTIPFWLEAVQDIPGAPPGAYWDGGITDYHLHLNYAAMGEGLVLYPHFEPRLVPSWFDKHLKGRHRATPFLDNLVLLAPSPAWIATLPGARLPTRHDFKTWVDDDAARQRAWRRAVAESARLADDFEQIVSAPSISDARPLG